MLGISCVDVLTLLHEICSISGCPLSNITGTFLSPARRGRGILVAPGFCPASRFLVGAKLKNYRISPCLMRCFFLAIHVTKRHLVLYIDVEFNTFFSFLAVSSAVSSLAVKHICKRRPVSVFCKQAYTTRTIVRLCFSN